ncbi:MAG TPA: DUF4337 domain-containing protein [Candidatus Sulfotelmatobacter sp.]|nr:DUF4337 domain-containing protein [Candidatus Sulfotelmatobacter sp.]
MSSEDLNELHEHAEAAHHDKSLAPVSLTMAVLAVLVAVVALLGHRAHTEEIVLQTKSTDQWAFYQAKNIRRHNDEIIADLASVISTRDTAALEKVQAKYAAEAEHYKNEQKDVQDEARKLEQEFSVERNRADRFDLAEVFLEVALVITSITLLSGKRIFWMIGMILGVIGIVVSITGFMVR